MIHIGAWSAAVLRACVIASCILEAVVLDFVQPLLSRLRGFDASRDFADL